VGYGRSFVTVQYGVVVIVETMQPSNNVIVARGPSALTLDQIKFSTGILWYHVDI